MHRRTLLKAAPLLLSGCGYLKVDPWSVYLRSDRIETPEQEAEVVSRAKLGWTDDGRVRVLYVRGSAYERGYQHGRLLRREVQENLGYMYEQALGVFRSAELLNEVYERLRPFIPQEYIDEMHGLAHGARMPLETIHAIHALPSLTEWGGKKRLKAIVKRMMEGEFGTSCSNLAAAPSATADGEFYVVRILDWGLHKISKLHEHPLITVNVPEHGLASANVGWVGFLGAVSGMNEAGITLGEMGYGDPPNETLRGKPMPFLLRDVLTYAHELSDVRRLISESPGTNSFVYLMSDGKTGDAELYVRDRDRFLVFRAGDHVEDGAKKLPPIAGITYGGHYSDLMSEELAATRGEITLDLLMHELIPDFAMKSNFHNVIYAPARRLLWVNNAKSPKERAAEQPYSRFDLGAALAEFTR